jgi:hypothetical protein
VDHRTASRAFLHQQGWRVDETTDAITAQDRTGTTLYLEFDHLGRLSKLSGTLQPD